MQPFEYAVPLVDVAFSILLVAAIALSVYARAVEPRAGFVVAQYERPAELDIIEAAYLDRATQRSFQAALVDLAVRRHIRIGREPQGEFVLTLLSLESLTPLELRAVHLVFGPTATVGAQRRALGREMRSMRRSQRAKARLDAAARRSLVARRFLAKPITTPLKALSSASILLMFGIFLGGFVLLSIHGFSLAIPLSNVYGLVVVIVISLLASKRGTRLTESGRELRDRLAGLKLFISVADADRLRILQGPQTALLDSRRVVAVYEKLLPFAILWDLEREWAKVLRHHIGAEPDWWFDSADYFDATLFDLSFALSTDTGYGDEYDGSEPGDPTDGSADGLDHGGVSGSSDSSYGNDGGFGGFADFGGGDFGGGDFGGGGDSGGGDGGGGGGD